MSSYSIALFVHIVSVAGVFAAFALEWAGLRQVQRSSVPERRIGVISMITLLLSGFYMARAAWHHVAWIGVSLGALVAIIVIGVTITKSRFRAMALQTRLAITVGIVFLMTVKPDMRDSLLAIAAAAVIGLVSALPGLGVKHA
jgi:hypothetical membrane protein